MDKLLTHQDIPKQKRSSKKASVSVRSIAAHLGISPATVSLALNGNRPISSVSHATRQSILDTAKDMGYPLERLRSSRSSLERVAIFLRRSANPVYLETALAMCSALNQHQVQIFTHLVESDQETSKILHSFERLQEMDAAVFIGSRTELIPTELPCVYIGEVPVNSSVWQVRIDNEGCGWAAAEFLWELGHRSIAVIVPPAPNIPAEMRLAGVHRHWKEQGADQAWIRPLTVELMTDMPEKIRALFSEDTAPPPTAIFCYNDWYAGHALKTLRKQGRRVPEEISVIGFDDSMYAELLDPPLTTIHTAFHTLGEQAAALLLEQSLPDASVRSIIIPCQIVNRQSCSPKK